ncbi:MAG: hypothetical protein WA687_07015 [Solirubrobacterales bacterium]
MRRTSKAATAGSTQRQAKGLGRIFRGAAATRGASLASKGSGAPKARRLLLPASALASIAALLAIAIPAGAIQFHPFKELFGSAAQPTFAAPRGIAIDQSNGDVLVMDAGPPSIKRYNADGTPDNFSALGSNVIDGQGAGDLTPQNGLGFANAFESQIAIDNSGTATDGNIYVTQGFPNAINIFSSTGAYLGQLTAAGATDFTEACGVAVDPAGAVYVGDFSSGIKKFVPAANPPVNADHTATFTTTTQPCTLAAGAGATAGFLFPTQFSGPISKIDSGTGELKYTVATGSNTTVTVNPGNGHVYAASGSSIKEFDASGAGAATTASSTSLSSSAQGVAVRGSSGDIFLSRSGQAKVEVLSAATSARPDVVTSPASSNTGVRATLAGTVNPDGVELSECFFEWGEGEAFDKVAPCAESNAAIGSGTSPVPVHADLNGLQPNGAEYRLRLVAKNPTTAAVKGSNQLFITPDTVITTAASGTTPTATTLNGTVNPDGTAITECLFEWGEVKGPLDLLPQTYPNTAPCVPGPGGIGSGTSPVAVSANLSGLHPGTAYVYRLKAANANGPIQGKDVTAQAAGPVIKAAWSESVIFKEATLKAEINPEGQATTYRIEYGPTGAYGSQTPELAVGSDSSVHLVTRSLEGLTPGTTYHYRVIATSVAAENVGSDQTFTTYEPLDPDTDCPNQAFRDGASANLPNCRAYEMATPADDGVDIVATVNLTGYTTNSDQAALDGNKLTFTTWNAFGDAVINAKANQFIATRGADGWSSHGITPAQANRPDTVSADVSNFTPRYSGFTEDLSHAYLLDDGIPPLNPDGLPGQYNIYLRDNSSETYETVTKQRFSPPPADLTAKAIGGLSLGGYSRDGSHMVFSATQALTPDAVPLDGTRQVYDYHHGELDLVSVFPNGEPAGSAFDHSAVGNARPSPPDVDENKETENAVSDDGSHIFWMYNLQPNGLGGRLFARIDGETTVAISDPISTQGLANFWSASNDGSQVIFSFYPDNRLNQDLYRFDVDTETLTLIAGEVNRNRGVLGVSEDASHVYFASREALAPGATAGQLNLYLDLEGAKTFIATLPAGDLIAEGTNGLFGLSSNQEVKNDFSRVTADGRLVFQSRGSLTGYDNTSLVNGTPAVEIFTYDPETQRLDCVSCNPSGSRPLTRTPIQPYVFTGEDVPFDPTGVLQSAAWLPTPRHTSHVPRMVIGDGSRIFFNAYDALVPEDTNGAQDVYQWEENGSGGCQRAGGCVSLISSGTSPTKSTFIDASRNGDDVFFRTDASVVPEDPGLIDIYDARVNGGFPHPASPPDCVGDGCQSVPAAPNDPTPASAGFRGAGDPTPAKPRRRCRVRKGRHGKADSAKRVKKANKRCRRAKGRAGR